MNVYESKGDSPHNLTVGFVVIFIIVGVFLSNSLGTVDFKGSMEEKFVASGITGV
jgi:hypothetical protein